MSERKWRIVWRENRRDAETQEGPAIYTSCRAAQNDADSLSKQHKGCSYWVEEVTDE